jgi:DNA primase
MERGLTEQDILKYNIGYCVSGLYQNRIIIPSYDSNGQLNYFVGRDFYKGGMKYKNPPISKDIVGFDLYINWNEPLILCEGVFDAISIKRNAIPLFGKTISKKLSTKIIEKKTKHIVIALDNDAFNQSIEMISKFLDMGVEVNFVKLQDNQDPGELGYIKMSEKINNSEAIGFKELMRMKIYGT